MKFYLSLLLIAFTIQPIFSQDNIIKKNGEEIKAKVVEVGTTEIKYKKFEKQNGPTYAINKSEVFMINYEDGTKDVINPIVEEKKSEPVKTEPINTEVKKESTDNQETTKSQSPPSKTKYNYIEKVREVQSKDPSFRFYAGNGWLLGPGLANPVVGMDLRFPRKNVFLRGLSVGVRACFKNLEGRDGDNDSRTDFSTAIFGGGVTVNYYAPLPIKIIQPYVVANVGVAMSQTYATMFIPNPSGTGNMIVGDPSPVEVIAPYGAFGVGCNFMIAKHFGFFVEAGYFRTAAINTGVVLKLF